MTVENWLKQHAARMDGRLVVITGGNSGLGFAAAEHFLSLGARVVLACRSEARAGAAAADLTARFAGCEVSTAVLDLAARASVDAFAQYMGERGEKIDVFLHSAGVYYPKEQTTADGLPTTVGVNFCGTAYLAEAMLPLMQENGRMIFTTSLVDRFGRVAKNGRPRGKEGYRAYAESKLLLSSYVLEKATARKAGEPAFLAVHPGITATALLDPKKTTHSPLFSRLGHAFLYLFTHKKEKAALTAIFAAAGVDQNGDPATENGDVIGPRGLFGISGFPRKTRFCRNVKKQAKSGKSPYTVYEIATDAHP